MVTSRTHGTRFTATAASKGLLGAFAGIAPLAGYGRRWLGQRTLRTINLVAGVIFLGFAIRLLWNLAQTFR